MSKVLFIKADPKPDDQSNTFQLANAFMEEYKKCNPDDEIITLDLYKEKIRLLDGQMISDLFSGVESEMRRHAKLFASADKYVIADPMWNLSIPAILKAYIDYIVYVGITFKYTENGPVGLLEDKPRKAAHIVSRGGDYSGGPISQYEMGDRYIRTILGFMGIHDIITVTFEMTNVLTGETFEDIKNKSHQQAREAANIF